MRHFGPSAADLAYLAGTAMLPWDHIWIQGGLIDARRSPASGVYEVSQLTLGREALLWLGAEAADVRAHAPFNEVFFISVSRDERYGHPAHEARWRPRRADLTGTPADLSFGPFVSPGRRYELVTLNVEAGTVEEPETVTVDNGLLVTAPSGERLLFQCDDGTPLDMFVTTRPDYIDAYLARAVAVRVIAT